MNNDIVIEHHLRSLGTEAASQHIAHVYCHEGECVVCYNDRHILFSAGDCMIVINNKLLDGIKPSADFKCTAIYIRTSFLKVCSPDNNYFVRGIMTLFTNPVMKLLPDEQEICQADFLNVEHRLHRTSHRFYQTRWLLPCKGCFLTFMISMHASMALPMYRCRQLPCWHVFSRCWRAVHAARIVRSPILLRNCVWCPSICLTRATS